MLKLFQKKNGAVTVFLTLIMVPMLFVAEFAMDASRIYGARVIISGGGDLAMNAALTEYDKVLQDMYGLFATSATEEELIENLGKYFKQTIEGIEPAIDGDDYAQAVLQQITTLLKGDPEAGLQIHNLIDLSSMGVEGSSYVPNSQLYQTEIVKKQIVEYMKYRGPVSIGSNLLEKIGMITDVKKQQKAIEKKVAYDESLNGIQDSLIDLNNILAMYVALAYENSVTVAETVTDADTDDGLVQFFKGGYANLTEVLDPLMIAGMCNEGLSAPTTSDMWIEDLEALQREVNRIEQAVGGPKDMDAYIYSNLDSYLSYLYKIKSNYNRMNGVVTNYYNDLEPIEVEQPEEKTEEELAEMTPEEVALYVVEYNEKLEKYTKYLDDMALYNSLSDAPNRMLSYMYDLASFRGTSSEAFSAGHGDEYLAYWIGNLEKERETLTKHKKLYENICVLQETTEKVIVALDALQASVSAAEHAGDEWEESINELSESALKESMGQQFKEFADGLNKDDISALRTKMLTNQIYFTTLRECIESMTYFNVQLFQKDVELTDIYTNVARGKNWFSSEGTDADNAMGLVSTAPIGSLCNEGDFLKLSAIAGEITVSDDNFYKYLQEFCQKLPPETLGDSSGAEGGNTADDAAQESAKQGKKNIIENVNSLKAECEEEEDVKNEMPSDGDYYADLATTLLSAVAATEVVEMPSDIEDNDEAEKQTQNAGEGLSNFNFDELANKLVAGLEGMRDDLYITEYMTEMFSCYTTGINPNGGAPLVVNNLSGYPIDANHNYLFGCEQEYILWGQTGDATNKNIAYTTASIFAIRYVLNLTYAFTSAEIQAFTLSLATAIAGWTIFGVPLIQTILILAIALGETAWDIIDLKAGKDVAIYKSMATWRLSPSGLTKEVLNDVIDETKNAAIDKANEIIGKTCTKIETIIDETVVTAKSEAEAAVNNIESEFQDYADTVVDGLVDQVATWLVTPLTSNMQLYLLSLESASTQAETSVSDALDEIYNKLGEEVEKESNCLAKEIKIQALAYFKGNVLDRIKSDFITACNDLNSATEESVQSITQAINDRITEEKNTLKTKIKDMTLDSPTYQNIKDECMQEFADCLNFDWAKEEITEAKNVASEKVSSAISSFADKMSYSVGAASETMGNGAAITTSKTEKGAFFTLNYQEYVKIFLLLAMIGEDKNQVARMCDLIKMNLCALEEAPNPDFKWSESYTMFNMRAKASVRTGIDFNVNEQNVPRQYEIVYNSYLGY